MKKYLFFAAALVALASCSDDNFVGNNSPNQGGEDASGGAIVFSSGAKAITRADHVGADAASLLSNKFIVGGFKGNYTSGQDIQDVTIATGKVFDNYVVQWGANTAGTTTSNTSDWEYVGVEVALPSSLYDADADPKIKQSIKYWDYSASQYDFIAYSTGNATIVTTGTAADAIAANKVLVTAITPTTAKTSAYQLSGKTEDLAKCYIADMVTVYKDGTDGMNYQDEVKFTFRNLASKARMAIYETVPGYSVKDVKFYTDEATAISTGTSLTDATLFTTGSAAKDHFYTAGTYTVYFPTIGKGNVTPSKATDYNKAHASFAVVGEGKATTKGFGTLQKVGRDYREADATDYIGRTATTASFAGTTAPYYKIVMPNEEGTVLELRVDYTLLSIDGSGEEIKVHGAKAFVPAIYAQWKPNYAYTYIFKISDNTNGWTSTVTSDPAGLYPITFDAIVVDSEEGTQSTITTVNTPAITTYQKGHAYNDGTPNDDYKTGKDIYVMVQDADLKDDLDSKGHLYTVSGANISEATVMDALNIRVTGSATVDGRNGIALTIASSTAVTEIAAGDSPDGNAVPVTRKYTWDSEPTGWSTNYTQYYTDEACTVAATSTWSSQPYYKKNTAVKFTPSAGIYAYVYKVSDGADTDIYSAVNFAKDATVPEGWDASDASKMEWYEDPDGNTKCTGTWDSSAFDPTNGKTYYRHYTNLNTVYAVKVIRVKSS